MRPVKRARYVGCLFDDLERLAESVTVELTMRDVTIWLNSHCELVCSGRENTPNVQAPYVVGTYSVGADVADIRDDLTVFRNERACNSIIF